MARSTGIITQLCRGDQVATLRLPLPFYFEDQTRALQTQLIFSVDERIGYVQNLLC